MLSSIPISQIDLLGTATESFDISKFDFEQLIQRDIDFERVEEIVEDYLEKGKNRVIFFPPLLVSLISVENGNIIEKYKSVTSKLDEKSKNITQTWDRDKFQLVLPISKDHTNTVIEHENEDHYVYNFGGVLKYNSQAVKLVVIDGQHRLTALKQLAKSTDESKNEIVKSVDIPICIVFSPDATVNDHDGETISNDLRELFVTINNKGKQVSGHFLTLLKDKSLSAIAVRDLADKWKNTFISGYSRLQFLEWNQREPKRAFTRQRKYSISTVSIISDCLESYLFNDPLATNLLLNLLSVSNDLKNADDSVAVEAICEDQFRPMHVAILKKCIATTVTSSLDLLLRKPRPYSELEKKYDKTCKWLDRQVEDNVGGAAAFKSNVLQQYRDINKFDAVSIRAISDEFIELIKEDADEYDGRYYFLNVFQQGLIRSWVALSLPLNQYEISPTEVAKALVPSLDLICFNKEKKLFDATRSYTQRTLFNGEKIIVNNRSKDLWKSLILSTLANSKVTKKCVQELDLVPGKLSSGNLKEISAKLNEVGRTNASSYIDEFKKSTRNDYEKYWREKDLSEAVVATLTKYSQSADEGDRVLFDDAIDKLVEERVDSAAETLSNVLEISKDSLFVL
jgi:hypothetical protein